MKDLEFHIKFGKEVSAQPLDGRVLLLVSNDETDEPRFQISNYLETQLIYGVDVDEMKPGEEVVINGDVPGYPLDSITQIPDGKYWVQAVLNKYETFNRSDGHTVKLHMDQGEGHKWNKAPGNLISTPKKVKIGSEEIIKVELDQVIPPFEDPVDTKYIKHVKIESKLLSEFWGRPMHLGAVVILPEGFEENPHVKYPLIVWHGHFNRKPYIGFQETPADKDIEPEPMNKMRLKKHVKDLFGPDVVKDPRYYSENNIVSQEYAYKLYKDWTGKKFPRMIMLFIQHATPYYDDSYAVNSANQGPYGDAINYELIPYIEEKFRGIGEGWARTLMGGSTGGWEVIATQIFYPDYYNGCWCWCPDPLDFRATCLIDIYKDKNAYYIDGNWKQVTRPSFRTTVGEVLYSLRDEAYLEHIKGNKCRGGGQWDIWMATYGPTDDNGYVKPLFDRETGVIDPEVAQYWRENYDLRYILERDWETIGPKLKNKIRIYCGDMDSHYLNNSVYLMEEFLEQTEKPYYNGLVEYGDRISHCYYGDNNTPSALDRYVLVQRHAKDMANHITLTAPEGADTKSWKY